MARFAALPNGIVLYRAKSKLPIVGDVSIGISDGSTDAKDCQMRGSTLLRLIESPTEVRQAVERYMSINGDDEQSANTIRRTKPKSSGHAA